MKSHYVVFIGVLLGAILTGCQKNQNLNQELKVTGKDPEIKATRADFEWIVEYPGKICSMVEISQNEDMTDATRYGSEAETVDKNFSATATGLEENTQYFYRYVVWNPTVQFEMEVKQFSTLTISKPVVKTSTVSGVTTSSAVCAGEVTDDGNGEVTERGVCWSIRHNPEVIDSHVSNGSGVGSFSVSMNGLTPCTIYYVRAYAVNSKGVSYGNETSFVTSYTGAVRGAFSVSYSQKVCFSQGNLQYKASSNTWRFAEHQYDCIGTNNSNIASDYSGWIDLFGWGTSGWSSGANCYQPWSTSITTTDYYPGGSPMNNLTGDCAQADWGVYNAISNGGNEAGIWRTLTKEEWIYLFDARETASDIRYAKACVDNVNGVVLLPDDWNSNYYGLSNVNSNEVNFGGNTISAAQWSTLEQYGAVFLSAAGYRSKISVQLLGSHAYYWSSSACEDFYAYCLCFDDSKLDSHDNLFREWGASVRLVHDIQ